MHQNLISGKEVDERDVRHPCMLCYFISSNEVTITVTVTNEQMAK